MSFRHPEILWTLFLLVIPVVVHLFQLRKFQKEGFTNVRLLQTISIKTRKSSQLKKWLTLATRMLALAAVIIAFAGPFRSNRNVLNTTRELVVYLDNSFSMQATGKKGELLRRAVNELLETIPADEQVALFTNTNTFPVTTFGILRNDLLDLAYSDDQLLLEDVFLKGKTLFKSDTPETIRDFVVISDFQRHGTDILPARDSLVEYHFVKLTPEKPENASIDSILMDSKDAGNTDLLVTISYNGTSVNIPVALYDNDKLIAKTSVSPNETNRGEARFTIPTGTTINGRVVIEDDGLQFDNVLYFNIDRKEKIKVLAISEADDTFLRKLFTEDEFNYVSFRLNQVDYNVLTQQDFIVLNEPVNIPNALITTLQSMKAAGKVVLIIPSINSDQLTYNQLLNSLNLPSLGQKIETEKSVTKILFEHPLYKGVFDNRVENFQYPLVKAFYPVSRNATSVLEFEDGSPFLTEQNGAYLFSAPLNSSNSTFQNSPLIVPTLYNIGLSSLKDPTLYFDIGVRNQFDIRMVIKGDGVLSLNNTSASFIPQQQSFTDHVSVTTDEIPDQAGIYEVTAENNEVLKRVSYNFKRSESRLEYLNTALFTGADMSSSVLNSINDIKSENKVNDLWKWFVIFALVFLLTEMLVLKYFK